MASNPTTEIYFCRALALRVYSARSVNLGPAFGGRGLRMEIGLKRRVYVLRLLAVIRDCTGARAESDARRARLKLHTHGLRTSPHTCMHHAKCE